MTSSAPSKLRLRPLVDKSTILVLFLKHIKHWWKQKITTTIAQRSVLRKSSKWVFYAIENNFLLFSRKLYIRRVLLGNTILCKFVHTYIDTVFGSTTKYELTCGHRRKLGRVEFLWCKHLIKNTIITKLIYFYYTSCIFICVGFRLIK